MTRVAILPVPTEKGDLSYRAVSGEKLSQGAPLEALDAFTPQLSIDEAGTLIIAQNLRSDHLFNAEQQQRLAS